MSKQKHQYGLEEEILLMICRLIDKKTSSLFRQPVDGKVVIGYYERIKNPIDISTIITKLKNSQYCQASQVKKDLELMMANCRQFNQEMDILKIAATFQKAIETQWTNLDKDLKKKNINISQQINITAEKLKNFDTIEDKYRNRKTNKVQNLFNALKVKDAAQYIIPSPPEHTIKDKREDQQQPKSLKYNPQKYMSIPQSQRSKLFHFQVNYEEIAKIFEKISIKKLAKYKKILRNRVMWIENKILKKCLQRKRYQKMHTPKFLSSFIENGAIADNLQLRKLQLYVKMAAYWIEDNQTILSYEMKNKFIDTCKDIKKCILRVLRYRKMSRSAKIQLDMQNQRKFKPDSDDEQFLLYENKLKSFKRMLAKDRENSIKRYTRIQIRNQDGLFMIVDWNFDSLQKRKINRSIIAKSYGDNQQSFRMQNQQRKRRQRQQDEEFLGNYRQKSPVQLIQKYHDFLTIDWDEILMRKMPKVIEFNFDNFIQV